MTRVKLFNGLEAKNRFENNFKERHCAPAREINLEFFYKEGFRCFEMFKFNGWQPFLNALESTILIRGRRAVLNKSFLSEVLQVPNHGICPDLADDIITESYSKGEFIKELIGKDSSVCHASILGADNIILFHIIDQVVMPKLNKANDLNNTELFVMWCLSRYLRVNLPHIIVSHMKHICQSSHELADGMVITRIAKYIKAYLSEYEGGEASFQSRFDIGLLHHIQFRKIGKHWVKKGKELEIVPKIEEVPELPKGSKQPRSPQPSLAALLKDRMNDNTLFRLLQEILRSSTFNHDAQVSHNKFMKEILDSINATNGLLTSIQFLLQKHITMASIASAAKGLVPPLRPKPQIEDVD
ncbi:uncharacterized protein G2W53_033453 [Senna tora]|uniref:Uncharacterized protein n=1 Tax=Senna tora TaxID=362788 RepID=A0A834T283_9FABA|nr:uncharacterized protein G2W53_033453 [Senna tora]